MKLRQKLAVALAAAMVVTAVPVVTMAESSNKVVITAAAIKKDTKTTTAGYLRMKFDDNDGNYEEEFYLELTNAEWLDGTDDKAIIENDSETQYGQGAGAVQSIAVSATNPKEWTVTFGTGTATYTRQSSNVVKVNMAPAADTTYILPLPIKATGGTISVATKTEGSASTITEGNYSFATTGEKSGTLTVGDAKSFYDRGEIAQLLVKETFVGSLTGDDLILKVELADTDFEFLASSDVKVKGTYGFDFTAYSRSTSDNTNANITVEFELDEDDDSTAYIHVKGLGAVYGGATRSLGRLEITGIKVDNDDNDIQLGELKADIKAVSNYNDHNYSSSTELDKTYSDVVLAKIADYGAYIEMKDEKAVDIVAGREKEITFKVSEAIDDSFVEGRKITLTLDNEDYTDSYFFLQYKGKDANYKADLIDSTVDSKDIIKSVEIEWTNDTIYTSETGSDTRTLGDTITEANAIGGYRKANAIIVTLQDDNNDAKNALNKNERIDWFKVKSKVYVPVSQKDKKEIALAGSMRGIDEFKGTTAVNVINPFEVSAETTTLKVGLQDQEAGAITITENDKAMFEKGTLTLNIANGSKIVSGIAIDAKGTLTTTGELKTTDFDNTKTTNSFELKRTSKSASTVTVDGMLITTDRTVPEGTYDLEISGSAIDAHDGKVTVKDYLVIGTPNTQDIIASNGLARGTATFAIGESKYTLNGEEVTMDAQSYIQEPGYTMVPVRYIAQAFGVAEVDIMFGNGTVTLFAGTRVIQLTNNSAVAKVNGVDITMATKVVIKDGRTYAPVGEIARILGVSSNWDNTTKTATFTNN